MLLLSVALEAVGFEDCSNIGFEVDWARGDLVVASSRGLWRWILGESLGQAIGCKIQQAKQAKQAQSQRRSNRRHDESRGGRGRNRQELSPVIIA